MKPEEKLLIVVGIELEIDEEGRIWRIATRRGIKGTSDTHLLKCNRRRAENKAGEYLAIRGMFQLKRVITGAHRLVYLFHKGPIPDGMQINHINGEKRDNRPSNLEVVTRKENIGHAIHVLKRHPILTQGKGENHPASKFSDAVILDIRRQIEGGKGMRLISDNTGVSIRHVYHIGKMERRPIMAAGLP